MTGTSPILCLITDRRRLAASLGLPWDDAAVVSAVEAQAGAAADAGVSLIQLREPDLTARQQADLARVLCRAVASRGVKVLVNDRVDVVLAAGAAGVHLKRASVSAAEVRRQWGSALVIGQSVHAVDDLPAAAAADYLIFGTVFPTSAKPPGWASVGADELAIFVRAAAGRPVLAVGGVSVETAPLVAASGAAGLAGIGAFLPTSGDLAASVRDRVRRLRMAFDSSAPLTYHGGNG